MGYSHYDIAHAWAHNLDSCHGYCSQSMSHSDGCLRSYSTVIGQRIERPGQSPLWLVQNASYSSSTAKHQRYMRNAMTSGPVVDVSKYGFKYGWSGIYTGSYKIQSIFNLCVDFIIQFYDLLKLIPNSTSIKSEDIQSPSHEINTLIEATGCISWKKIASRDWGAKENRTRAIQLRKLTVALEHGNMSIPQLVVAVFGAKAWAKHIALTLPQQKARETRRSKEIPGYKPIDFNTIEAYDFEAEVKAARERQRREDNKNIANAMKRKADWLAGKAYTIDAYGLSVKGCKKLFDGGNVALRIHNGVVQTSKGISIPFDECARLWILIKRWHNNNAEFHRDVCHATANGWVISSFKNDIMTAGCHSIAYSEMARIAKELKLA